MLWCLFAFLCECGGLPYGNTGEGKLVLRNDLQARISKQAVTLSKQNAVKSMFLRWMKGKQNKTKQCFQASISNCLDSKMWELQVRTEALISRVTVSMFPHISEPCEPIPRPYWACPWRNSCRSVSVSAECLLALLLNELPCHWKRSSGKELQVACLLQKSQRFDQILLSQVRKEQLDGFPGGC